MPLALCILDGTQELDSTSCCFRLSQALVKLVLWKPGCQVFRRVAYSCWESQQPSSDCTWSPCGEPRSCIDHPLGGTEVLALSRELAGNVGRSLLFAPLTLLPPSTGCFYITLDSFRSSSIGGPPPFAHTGLCPE